MKFLVIVFKKITLLVGKTCYFFRTLFSIYQKNLQINLKKSLVSCIKENLREFRFAPPSVTNNKPFKNSPKSRIIESKVSDGDIRGAIRILSSNLGISDNLTTTFAALSDMHPSPSRPLHFPLPPSSDVNNLFVSTDLVSHAILSFPCGSSSGIDGLRPQHIKDLISPSAGEAGIRLLKGITNFCNFVLAGKVLDEVCPIFMVPLCLL